MERCLTSGVKISGIMGLDAEAIFGNALESQSPAVFDDPGLRAF